MTISFPGRDRQSQLTFEDLRGLRAEAYIRDSTPDQRDGFGPDIQCRNIQRFAESYSLVLGNRWYTEFVTGRRVAKRKEFQEFLEDAQADLYDVLLVDHTSRFGRNQEECIRFKSELRQLGKVVVFVSQGIISGSDRDFLSERINETLDEQYSRNLSRYVLAGMAEKAAQGLANGMPPLGYRSEFSGNGKREKKVPNWEGGNGDPKIGGMEALLALLRSYASGKYSYLSLAETVNSQGCRHREGGPFTKGSVEHVLLNRFYQGKVVYHPGEADEAVRDGVHEVPDEVKELWLRCQEVKWERTIQKEGRPRSPFRAYPFTGLTVCEACGLSYSGQPVLQKSGEVVRRLYHKRPFCDLRPHSVKVENLMTQFQEGVLPYIELDQEWQAGVTRALCQESQAPNNDYEQARLQQALANLRKQHLWGDISDQQYREQKGMLERQLRVLTATSQPIHLPNLSRAAELLNELPSLWMHPGVTDQQREELIKEVFEQAQIRGSKLTSIKPKTSYRPLFAYMMVEKVRNVVGAGRFELPTSWSQTRRPTAGPRPEETKWKKPAGGRWYPRRGSNSRLWLRRPALYPLSYRGTLSIRITRWVCRYKIASVDKLLAG